MAVFWVVASCSLVEVYRRFIIAMMMETVSTSETLVNFYHTKPCTNSEDRLLHTRRKIP
jgi:hypothetical protein